MFYSLSSTHTPRAKTLRTISRCETFRTAALAVSALSLTGFFIAGMTTPAGLACAALCVASAAARHFAGRRAEKLSDRLFTRRIAAFGRALGASSCDPGYVTPPEGEEIITFEVLPDPATPGPSAPVRAPMPAAA